MAWTDTLNEIADRVFETEWNVRDGNVVPEADTVALADGAVQLEAAFLYADLANSSALARHCPWKTTAKIIRAYLECATRLIRAYGGEIRSFDGDRVMGVFIGDMKATYSTRCAREIDWTVEKVLGPKAKENFKSVRENGIEIRHGVGVDVGTATAVRAGIRDNNDLIWIGRPPSFAAKLSDIRDYPYSVHITKACFYKLAEAETKLPNGEAIWEQRSYPFAGEQKTVYRTKRMLTP